MADPFLGEIRVFSFNFAPRGWALCNGQLLSIQQNSALFALLGTFYGGNGVQTFALPNLQSRMPIFGGQGAAPGLPTYQIGQVGGEENHILAQSEMPRHGHSVVATSASADLISPSGNFFATGAAYNTTPDTTLDTSAVGLGGGSQPHDNMPPYGVLNLCIALAGIFPSRN